MRNSTSTTRSTIMVIGYPGRRNPHPRCSIHIDSGNVGKASGRLAWKSGLGMRPEAAVHTASRSSRSPAARRRCCGRLCPIVDTLATGHRLGTKSHPGRAPGGRWLISGAAQAVPKTANDGRFSSSPTLRTALPWRSAFSSGAATSTRSPAWTPPSRRWRPGLSTSSCGEGGALVTARAQEPITERATSTDGLPFAGVVAPAAGLTTQPPTAGRFRSWSLPRRIRQNASRSLKLLRCACSS
jgi:hypothetical protein